MKHFLITVLTVTCMLSAFAQSATDTKQDFRPFVYKLKEKAVFKELPPYTDEAPPAFISSQQPGKTS